jgi:hypothetical protein
MDAQGRIGS